VILFCSRCTALETSFEGLLPLQGSGVGSLEVPESWRRVEQPSVPCSDTMHTLLQQQATTPHSSQPSTAPTTPHTRHSPCDTRAPVTPQPLRGRGTRDAQGGSNTRRWIAHVGLKIHNMVQQRQQTTLHNCAPNHPQSSAKLLVTSGAQPTGPPGAGSTGRRHCKAINNQ
jgi:hypothetical protein